MAQSIREPFRLRQGKPFDVGPVPPAALAGMYALALAASVSTWFLAIRAPLWLDETLSFFIIKGRLTAIVARQGWPGVPAYPFLLWIWTRTIGTGELALRMSSVLAMLAAVGFLYAAARELFGWDVAACAVVLFCLHPIVLPESIDIRPYACAALAINASIFLLVRLRSHPSNWLAALLGLSAACIVYFQFLFVVIAPVLAVCLLALKSAHGKRLWRQFAVACTVFALSMLPVLPGMHYLLHTRTDHVFAAAPAWWEFAQVVLQTRPALTTLLVLLLLAAILQRLNVRSQGDVWRTLVCWSLGLAPILMLYEVSAHTSTRIFVFRYRLVGVPGIVLLWAWVLSRIDSRALRLSFCLIVAGLCCYTDYRSPVAAVHFYTWKYALEAAEANARTDNAPVILCSDLPESDHWTMPAGDAVKDSAIFPPLSYYPLSVPVIGMPRTLNEQATRVGSKFVQGEAARHARFLAMAYFPSYATLDWLEQQAPKDYAVQKLGVFDGVRILIFTPRAMPGTGRP